MSENVQVVTDLPAKNFFRRIPTTKVAVATITVVAVAVVAKIAADKFSQETVATETTEA